MSTAGMEREQVRARRVRLGALVLDRDAYAATFGGRRLSLTASQIEVLACLMENPRRVVSRTELARAAGLLRTRSVDALLCSLRKEVGCDFLRNVRNRGWIILPGSLEP